MSWKQRVDVRAKPIKIRGCWEDIRMLFKFVTKFENNICWHRLTVTFSVNTTPQVFFICRTKSKIGDVSIFTYSCNWSLLKTHARKYHFTCSTNYKVSYLTSDVSIVSYLNFVTHMCITNVLRIITKVPFWTFRNRNFTLLCVATACSETRIQSEHT